MLISLVPSFIIDGFESMLRKKKIYSYNLENRGENYDFTILVPVYNKEKTIHETLSSLELYKEKTIIIDDASTDNSFSIIKKMGFDVIKNEINGKKVGAIKKGLENVSSKYTVIIDADTVMEKPRDLPKLIQALYDENLVAGAVQVLPKENSSVLSKLQYIEYKIAMELGRKSMNNLIICISGAFGAFSTKELKEVTELQANNPKFEGEDFERTLYLLEKGKIGYFSDFIVRTEVPSNLLDLTKQRIRWQYGYFDEHFKFKRFLKRKDAVGYTFLYNFIVNIGLHPFKLLFFYYLLSNPIDFMGFYLGYAGLEAILYKLVANKDEFSKYGKYSLIYPTYSLYNLFVPTTIGYFKAIKDYFKKFSSYDNKTVN